MMTLEEAIMHAESKAWKNSREADRCFNHGGSWYEEKAKSCKACAEEHRQLAEWLRELQRYQWIPVEERLPHDGEKILACYDDGVMLAMQFYAWARFSFIAWMPLPEPYEPRGEQDE